jgi:hypothetical protein
LGKNHLWTNSFTPWNFSPVFSANGSWIAQRYPRIFSNIFPRDIISGSVETSGNPFSRTRSPKQKWAKTENYRL